MFEIKDATFEVNGKPILNPIEHTFHEGKVYGLIGHNGSGKSTLAAVLLGSPEYVVTKGRIRFRGDDITDWSTDVRGKAGIFLAFQYPLEIAGVSVINFLRQSLSARKGIDLSVLELRLSIMEWMERLGIDPSFADRYVNEGFSGGEKKRNEILQMAILEPEVAILDETDSGLDIDAFASRLSFFFVAQSSLFEEVAKFRAARRMWARIVRERFGAMSRTARRSSRTTRAMGATATRGRPGVDHD